MAKRIAFVMSLMTVLVLALLALPANAIAEGSASSSSAPYSADGELPQSGYPAPLIDELHLMGNDCLWAGRNLVLGGHEVKNDLLAAGQSVSIKNCKAGGSIRAAAQDVTITGSSADQNITIAGQTVSISDSKGNVVAMAGSTASFSGSCKELSANASKVFIDGVVDGDVYVGASQVEIGSNARIKGTLHVSAASEPAMERGAEVGNVDFTKSESPSVEATGALVGLGMAMLVIGAIVTVFGTIVVAVLSEWLFKRHTFAAAKILRSRTGATIAAGIVGAIVMPVAIVILFCLVITVPVAIALVCALVAIGVLCGGFMGASLFKLVFPRLGRFKCALAGGAIVGVASAIPLLGMLVRIVAFVYMLGYVLQSIYLGMREPAPTAGLGGTAE